MIRDDELNRLIRYSQGMGVSVRFKPFVKGGNRAEWVTDGNEVVVTIYVTSRSSKLEKILSLIHELSHHKAFVNNERTISKKVEEALGKEAHTKMHRKHIFDMEFNDSKYWEQIYKDANCQFGLDKLETQRQFDVWVYQYYYEVGKWPTWNEKLEKKKELRRK